MRHPSAAFLNSTKASLDSQEEERCAAWTDKELIEKLREGHASAGVELLRRYRTRLAGFLWRRVTEDDELIELLQETFSKFVEYADRHSFQNESEDAVENTLFTIARNLAVDAARRKSRWELLTGALSKEEPAPPPTPEALLLAKETRTAVRDKLAGLPRLLRWTMTRLLEGRELKELADETNTPVETLRKRRNRARRQLAAELEDILGKRRP